MRSEHDHVDDANSLALVISGMPEVWQRLLDEHVPDDSGRCVACRSSRSAGVLWPCTLRVIADDARAICLAAGSLPGEPTDRQPLEPNPAARQPLEPNPAAPQSLEPNPAALRPSAPGRDDAAAWCAGRRGAVLGGVLTR